MRKLLLLFFSLLSVAAVTQAQWTDNTQVNTEASGTATGDSKSLVTSSGKSWFAWFKNVPAPNYFEMRAQLLDKNGVKLLGPEGMLVNGAAHPSFTTIFHIATDSKDNLIVAFANSSTNTIYVNKVDTNGVQVWNSAGVQFASAGLFPRIGVLKNDDVVLCWLTGSGTKASMQKINGANGQLTWPSIITVATANAAHRSTPGDIFPLTGNHFLLVFHNRTGTTGTASTLWAQRYNADGVAQWAAPVQLTDKTTAYNREYNYSQVNDTVYAGITAATGLRTDAYVHRINPDGTLPWGLNGVDFATDNTYYEPDIKIVAAPKLRVIWAYGSMTNTSQSNRGTSIQKINMSTGARMFTDNAKVVYPLSATLYPYVSPLGIAKYSDDLPVFLLGRVNSATSQFLYAAKFDQNGNFVWPGDTVRMGTFPATKSRMILGTSVNDQTVATWVERKGTFDQPYAQPIRINGATGLTAPVASFTQDTTKVCAVKTVQFTSNSSSYIASYSWTFAGGTPATSTAANPVVQYNTPGVYPVSLTVTNAAGTNQITKTNLITVSGVASFAGPDQVIVAGDAVTLSGSASPNTVSYQWSPAATMTSPNSPLTRATPANTTVYTLTVKNTDNCEASDNVTITVLPYCVDIKNAFSPNKDGINELWVVTNGNCTEKVKAVVMSRYGQEVYRNENYTNNWDGTYKGKPVPDGTYYYVLTYHFIGGRIVTLKGDVTILR